MRPYAGLTSRNTSFTLQKSAIPGNSLKYFSEPAGGEKETSLSGSPVMAEMSLNVMPLKKADPTSAVKSCHECCAAMDATMRWDQRVGVDAYVLSSVARS